MKIHTHRRRKLCVSAPPSRCSLMVIRNTILANNPTPVSWLSCWWCVVVPLLLTDQTLTSRTVNSHQSSLTIKSIYLTTQPGMIGGFGAWQKYHKEKHEKKKGTKLFVWGATHWYINLKHTDEDNQDCGEAGKDDAKMRLNRKSGKKLKVAITLFKLRTNDVFTLRPAEKVRSPHGASWTTPAASRPHHHPGGLHWALIGTTGCLNHWGTRNEGISGG